MNVDLICIRCMREKENGQSQCPWCGFDAASYRAPGGALPPMTILHGRYLAGCSVMEKYTFAYSAIDLENEKRVRIRELFMPGLMTRRPGALEAGYERDAAEIMLSAAKQFYRIGQDAAALGNIPGMYPVIDVFDENNTIYQVSELPDTADVPCSRLDEGEHVGLDKLMPVLEAVKALNLVQITPCLVDKDHILITADGTAKLDFVPVPYEMKQGSNVWFVPEGELAEENGAPWGTWSDVYACARMIRSLGADEQVGKKGQELLEKALSVQPNDRPQTMDIFLGDLSESVRTHKEPGKGRIVVECLIALAISLAVGALIYFLIVRQQRPAEESGTETESVIEVLEDQTQGADASEAGTQEETVKETEKETQEETVKETEKETVTETELTQDEQTDGVQEEESGSETEKSPLQNIISM